MYKTKLENIKAPLDNSAKLSLYKKSLKFGIPTNILEEVYQRGYDSWEEGFVRTQQQFAFDRVNSFLSGGLAYSLDSDLIEQYTGAEATSNDSDKPNSRFIGTDNIVNVFKKSTPGQETINTIKRVLKDKRKK